MTDIIPEFTQGVFDFGEPDHTGEKYCPQCEQWLPETAEFWHRKGEGHGFRVPCKACRHDKEYLPRASEMIAKQREAFLAKSAEEQEKIRDRWNTHRRERSVQEIQRGMCSSCLARPTLVGKLCEQCSEKMKRYADDLRDQVLAAYGGVCIQCGESHPAFLAIDHINDDGAEHRRIVGGGQRLYRWLRKNGFPEGFQLLCHNHNWLKRLQSPEGQKKTYIQFWHAQLRAEVIEAYGGKCSCCGLTRPEVLTVDHVNNDGAEHRKHVGAGSPLYSWLRKNGFPQDGRFQLLCFSCNIAKQVYGVCPHQQ